ncbi:MAG: hypothetical protein HKN79_07745, partial [Flavobacteriales bacterium]|nr:hypothetical protein [Flavobacteriales bacterium]
VVETLFIHALAEGVFNPQVTLEGYNYDMLFALTALPIGYAVYQKRWLPELVIVLWNYLGLAVLASVIFLFMASLYKPQVFGSESPLLPLEAMSYPYVLIAGFLMPSAVFLHMLSLVQFRKRK